MSKKVYYNNYKFKLSPYWKFTNHWRFWGRTFGWDITFFHFTIGVAEGIILPCFCAKLTVFNFTIQFKLYRKFRVK